MARPVHDRSVTKYLRRKKKERKKGRKKERKKKVERREDSSGHVVQMLHRGRMIIKQCLY